MGIIKKDEIIGYFIDEDMVCCKCLTEAEEKSGFTQNQIITEDFVERESENGNVCYCDRCNEEL